MKLIFSAFLVLALSSCRFLGMGERVTGNGQVRSESRNVTAFNSVDVSGSVTVRVKQEGAAGVKLETDENLLPYIEVFTEGSTLVIRSKKGYNLNPSNDIIAYVSAPEFRDIDASGSCDIIGDNTISGNAPLKMSVSGSGNIVMDVQLPKVETSVSGSGSVSLKGNANEFDGSISGSGEVKCFDLVTESSSLSISGAGDAEVNASKKLDVRVSGSGNVAYKGNPSVSQSISGAGSVKKAG